jgi:cell division protease FtsH
MSGSEFVEIFVGIGAARVRDLFDQAKKAAPCIVFIDEIETIGRHRGRSIVNANEEREQTLNQLLTEMDGFDPTIGIIVMAATNRPDLIDSALLRPGRFDRRIFLERPDIAGREAILALHAAKVAMAPDVDLRKVAARTPGFAGAELANVVNEAALLAARAGSARVGMDHLNEAVDRVMTGLEQRSRTLSEKEKERVAHHEMGHALAALLLPHADPVHKVSIIPRGRAALGMTVQAPLEDRYVFTREELEDRIAVELGGRAAEQVVFGDCSTGAADDLQKATVLAVRMVREFGMSEDLGPVAYPDGQDAVLQELMPGERPYSDETARRMDVEVEAILSRNYDRTLALLKGRAEDLQRLAKELQTRETMSGDELRERLSIEPEAEDVLMAGPAR